MIAALFVAADGPYANVPGVDAWDVARDARAYAGPHPVVAHPPCERWGRYWHGGPGARVRKILGDDNGCFASALASVRRWSGVLEHPEASHAWPAHGLTKPPKRGGWIAADDLGGWTCCVEQGHYGHRARKATWLYVFDADRLRLIWGPSAKRVRLDDGCHSAAERARLREQRARFMRPPAGMTAEERATGRAFLEAHERETGKAFCCPERLSKRERWATPIPFRNLLLRIAQSAIARRQLVLFTEVAV